MTNYMILNINLRHIYFYFYKNLEDEILYFKFKILKL